MSDDRIPAEVIAHFEDRVKGANDALNSARSAVNYAHAALKEAENTLTFMKHWNMAHGPTGDIVTDDSFDE